MAFCKTHTLSDNYWSVKSMVRAVDCLYYAMLKSDKDGWKILDEQFMLNIFKPLKLKALDKYVKYIFDLKKLQLLVPQGKYLERKSKSNCSTQPAKRIK